MRWGQRTLHKAFAEGAGEDGGVAGDEEVFFDPVAAGFAELLAQRRVVGEALKAAMKKAGLKPKSL
jgi:hypothetical protein